MVGKWRGMKKKHHRAVLFSCGGVRAVLFRLNSLRHPPASNDCSYTWTVEQIFLGKHSTSIKLPLGFLLSGPEGKEIRKG